MQVTNLLVRNFKEDPIHAALHLPGSLHNCKLAPVFGLYWPLLRNDKITLHGCAILGERAFVNNTRTKNSDVFGAQRVDKLRVYQRPLNVQILKSYFKAYTTVIIRAQNGGFKECAHCFAACVHPFRPIQ